MEVAAPTEADLAYLDSARDRILAVGWRRTTLTDVARSAGVSRMTIYRRWPDMQALLADLLVREWAGLFETSGLAEVGPGDDRVVRQRLTHGVPGMVAAVRDNELFARIVDLDPELLHPYLFERLGRNQHWVLESLVALIRAGQRDGSVRGGDPDVLAQALLLTSYGFVLSARTFDSALGALDAELARLVDRYLAP